MKKKMYRIFVRLLVGLLLLVFFPSPSFAAPPSQGEDLKAKADALYVEGVALYNQADYQGAINRFEEALTIYQSIRDQAYEGATLNYIGLGHGSLRQYLLDLF